MPFFPEMNRDEFKKKVFSRIFYNDEKKYEYEEWFTFQDIFPNFEGKLFKVPYIDFFL